jgi:hypothetical protein
VIRAALPPAERAEIRVGADLERMTDEAIAALSHDSRVYQRGGSLCGVITVADGPQLKAKDIRRAIGTPVIRVLAQATIRERLSACLRWIKFAAREKQWVACLPPDDVVSAVAARGEWGGVRSLISVATSPVLKPDGTVLQTPGYDADTGILYWPREAYAEVSENPTIEDARGALEAICEVVCDFPFAKPEHRSAWIAGLLTMLARPAIDGPVPLFAVDATTRGTGKSRLVDAAVWLAHGQDAARTSLPEDDDEMRKRITSIVLEGDPAVCLDNVTSAIVFPSLDAVLTSMTWKDRFLGTNTSVTAPHRSVWWATGNNLVLGGDLSRRSLHVRLESPYENPEERTGFRHPELIRWVRENRKRLVASCLTILRAFIVAGSPYEGKVWGSFEAWSRLIPGALVWSGFTDPLWARATTTDSDSERDHLRTVMQGITLLFGTGSATTKAIVAQAFVQRAQDTQLDDFRSAVEEITKCHAGKIPEHTKLGYYMRRVRGRVMGAKRIVRPETTQNVARWMVEEVALEPLPEPPTHVRDRRPEELPPDAPPAI